MANFFEQSSSCSENFSDNAPYFGIYNVHPSIIAASIPRPQSPFIFTASNSTIMFPKIHNTHSIHKNHYKRSNSTANVSILNNIFTNNEERAMTPQPTIQNLKSIY